MRRGAKIEIEGIVQGVGFRPFIYNLAISNNLSGWVLNSTDGVSIEVEGEEDDIKAFYSQICAKRPPQARIAHIKIRFKGPSGLTSFNIRESLSREERSVLVPPDLAICAECLSELFDPEDRRYEYPFINCTNCGPRFTIIKDIPYDRDKTTMEVFVMCSPCQAEYEDPSHRRFHAQPNACPVCGPEMKLRDKGGRIIDSSDPILKAAQSLQEGCIVAVKGLGGYHLACDAENPRAVMTLRSRKHREDKPFAIMVYDLEMVRRFCHVSPVEADILTSPSRPIVLLRKRRTCTIAEAVAPRQGYLGIMLPYTPLHYLLLKKSQLPLVMTSGNTSDEPIVYDDSEALGRLGSIADLFLTHNRKIHSRCDDSVTRVIRGREMIIRRARGYVPNPIELPFRFKTEILACGAQLKNTFCLTKGNYAFLSQHLGDLENLETLTSFQNVVEHFKRLFSVDPKVVAYDLHPEYLSTKYALSQSDRFKVGVQHHHAHVVSCLVDNGLRRKVIGVAFDGTGYGPDGEIWGGEFLVADLRSYRRVAHFQYVPMPGGDKAILQPWRMAASWLLKVYGDDFLTLNLDFVKRIDPRKWAMLRIALTRGINSPLTSSVGRLFDAISSLIGIRDEVNYEGQAAVELEMIADPTCRDRYDFEITKEKSPIVVRPGKVIQGVVEDIKVKAGVPIISAKFHNTIAAMITNVCLQIRERTGLKEVALSGGVFQNAFLLNKAIDMLTASGFTVFTHHQVPPNDGGISLGQAVIANFSSSHKEIGLLDEDEQTASSDRRRYAALHYQR
ncbi:MAG TPA: carbamoyltransferase HypF [Candidatus Latescibacteria bacterium]|nr:carbamoyltransferase HypF [Candidatus Latescibacterota bacterium]